MITLHGGTIGVVVLDMSDGVDDERTSAASALPSILIPGLFEPDNKQPDSGIVDIGRKSLQADIDAT